MHRWALLVAAVLLAQSAFADDRPDPVKPWVQPSENRARIMQGLGSVEPRAYEDRSADRAQPVEVRRNTQRPILSTAPSVGRTYQDRSATSVRIRRGDHAAFQYRSSISGTRQRLERENRSDRRSFDRLQTLRREESRMRR